MGRIYAIAINTFREAVRDRVLFGVLGAGCAMLLFSLALAELSLNEERRVVNDIGLASISLFAVLVSIFLGSSLLYKEIERKTLYVILPKPIRRSEFLLGKFVGICLTSFVFVGLMGSLQLWVTAVQADVSKGIAYGTLGALAASFALAMALSRDRTAVVVPWTLVAFAVNCWVVTQTDVRLVPIAAQLALVLGEVVVLASVAMFFSSFSTPFLTGVFTLGVWLAGRSADAMVAMKSKTLTDEIKAILKVVAEILPNLNFYVPGRAILNDETPHALATYLSQSLGYAVLYSAAMLTLAVLIFNRRDFA